MTRYLLWRVAQFPLLLAVIYLMTFLLVWVAPGSPFQSEKKLDPLVEQELKQQYHAGSAMQFLGYYPKAIVLHGDFGPSMTHQGWSVGQIMAESLRVSVTLGLLALTIATLLGCALGTAPPRRTT
jgi:oligopeptide transport system permease protein